MKLRLIETRLLTVKINVNTFHGNERTYAIQSRHNSSAKYYKVGDQDSVEVEGVEAAHLLVKFNAWTSRRLLNRINLKDSCVSSIW